MVNDHLSADYFQLLWSKEDEGMFGESGSMWFEVKNDGVWRKYMLNMSNDRRWNGIVRRLRINAVRHGNSSGEFGIDYIRFAAGQ